MTKSATAKVFMSGRSQAVRIPKEFRLSGTEVRIRKEGTAIILEPIEPPMDFEAWVASWSGKFSADFMAGNREQPPTPPGDDISFDTDGKQTGGQQTGDK